MAGLDLGTARIKVTADTQEAQNKLGLIGKGTESLGTIAKGVGASMAIATGAVVGLTKASIEQYAQYEQLIGGVETLFKESGKQVIEYANNAYKTAGLSANEYMETITGFSASLLQSLGGDTKKAAEIGNMAVTDMADNANKMGTSMESIQNAYQGFAKQNYTMLDNLKLGYGGTKAEMERLLKDAEKLTGMKYDISNFDDIIEAIHAIQEEMGITGTTAKEASSTIEGSLNMTKSAWTNLLTGMADDNANFDTLVDNLVDSASALGENLIPRIEITIKGIGEMIERLLPPIVERIPSLITEVLPDLLNAGVQMVSSLGSGLLQAMPTLIDCGIQAIKTILEGITNNLSQIVSGAMEIVSSLIDGIVEVLPMLLEAGLQLLTALGRGIAENLPALIPTIVNLMISICDTLIENLPLLLEVAIEIILALTQGLIDALPTFIKEVPRIINEFSNAIYNNLPLIIEAGIKIIAMLIVGLIQSIPTLVANIPQIIMAIVNCFTLYNWSSVGKGLVTKLGEGIKGMKGNIGTIAKGIAEKVKTSISSIFSGGSTWGKNLVTNISQGISSMKSSIANTAKSIATGVLDAIKTKFANATSIGKTLIDNIKNGILGAWSGFTSWVSKKLDSIKLFKSVEQPEGTAEPAIVGNPLARGFSDMPSLFGATPKKSTIVTNLNIDGDNKENKELKNLVNKIDTLLSQNKEISIEVPVVMEGRQIARASAKYMETEMNKLSSRRNRLAGAVSY